MKAMRDKNLINFDPDVDVYSHLQHHKERMQSVHTTINNTEPHDYISRLSFLEKRPMQQFKKHVDKQNLLLANSLYKIMDGTTENKTTGTSLSKNHYHAQHPGTLNYNKRIKEAQKIYEKNLKMATRLEDIKPVLTADDILMSPPSISKTTRIYTTIPYDSPIINNSSAYRSNSTSTTTPSRISIKPSSTTPDVTSLTPVPTNTRTEQLFKKKIRAGLLKFEFKHLQQRNNKTTLTDMPSNDLSPCIQDLAISDWPSPRKPKSAPPSTTTYSPLQKTRQRSRNTTSTSNTTSTADATASASEYESSEEASDGDISPRSGFSSSGGIYKSAGNATAIRRPAAINRVSTAVSTVDNVHSETSTSSSTLLSSSSLLTKPSAVSSSSASSLPKSHSVTISIKNQHPSTPHAGTSSSSSSSSSAVMNIITKAKPDLFLKPTSSHSKQQLQTQTLTQTQAKIQDEHINNTTTAAAAAINYNSYTYYTKILEYEETQKSRILDIVVVQVTEFSAALPASSPRAAPPEPTTSSSSSDVSNIKLDKKKHHSPSHFKFDMMSSSSPRTSTAAASISTTSTSIRSQLSSSPSSSETRVKNYFMIYGVDIDNMQKYQQILFIDDIVSILSKSASAHHQTPTAKDLLQVLTQQKQQLQSSSATARSKTNDENSIVNSINSSSSSSSSLSLSSRTPTYTTIENNYETVNTELWVEILTAIVLEECYEFVFTAADYLAMCEDPFQSAGSSGNSGSNKSNGSDKGSRKRSLIRIPKLPSVSFTLGTVEESAEEAELIAAEEAETEIGVGETNSSKRGLMTASSTPTGTGSVVYDIYTEREERKTKRHQHPKDIIKDDVDDMTEQHHSFVYQVDSSESRHRSSIPTNITPLNLDGLNDSDDSYSHSSKKVNKDTNNIMTAAATAPSSSLNITNDNNNNNNNKLTTQQALILAEKLNLKGMDFRVKPTGLTQSVPLSPEAVAAANRARGINQVPMKSTHTSVVMPSKTRVEIKSSVLSQVPIIQQTHHKAVPSSLQVNTAATAAAAQEVRRHASPPPLIVTPNQALNAVLTADTGNNNKNKNNKNSTPMKQRVVLSGSNFTWRESPPPQQPQARSATTLSPFKRAAHNQLMRKLNEESNHNNNSDDILQEDALKEAVRLLSYDEEKVRLRKLFVQNTVDLILRLGKVMVVKKHLLADQYGVKGLLRQQLLDQQSTAGSEAGADTGVSIWSTSSSISNTKKYQLNSNSANKSDDSKISALKRRIAASKMALAAKDDKTTRAAVTKATASGNKSIITSGTDRKIATTAAKSGVSYNVTAVKIAPSTSSLSFIQRAQSAAAIAAATETSDDLQGTRIVFENEVLPAQPISPPRRNIQQPVRSRVTHAPAATSNSNGSSSNTSNSSNNNRTHMNGAAKGSNVSITPIPPSERKPAATRASTLNGVSKNR